MAERSGDTAFRLRIEPPKRRGASLPAAIQKDLAAFSALRLCVFALNPVVIQYTRTKTAASCADLTTSSNFRSAVIGSFSLAETVGTDSRKLKRKPLFTP